MTNTTKTFNNAKIEHVWSIMDPKPYNRVRQLQPETATVLFTITDTAILSKWRDNKTWRDATAFANEMDLMDELKDRGAYAAARIIGEILEGGGVTELIIQSGESEEVGAAIYDLAYNLLIEELERWTANI